MKRGGALVEASVLLAWLLLRRAPDATSTGDAEAKQDPGAFDLGAWDYLTNMNAQTNETTAARNVAAGLLTIRKAEGTAGPNGYRTLFGGALFDGYADHPRRAKQFRDGAGRLLWTSAAGAYQFMAVSPLPGGGSTRSNTWDRIAAKLGLADFSPASQDAAALELIREAGALGDLRAGRFDVFIGKCKGIWASLPGAGYSQPERSLSSLRVAFITNGGTIA